jgi:hypothetical protein
MKEAAEQLYNIEKKLEKWGAEFKQSKLKMYLSFGEIFNKVHESEIWKAGDWKNFKEWLKAIGHKHTTAYDMMKFQRTYGEVDGLEGIDVRRLLPLIPFFEASEDKEEMLSKARELLTKDYDDYIRELQDKPTQNECDHTEVTLISKCKNCGARWVVK